jgi:hypothetical protein
VSFLIGPRTTRSTLTVYSRVSQKRKYTYQSKNVLGFANTNESLGASLATMRWQWTPRQSEPSSRGLAPKHKKKSASS